jgi:hypothetical protein
MGVDLGDDVVGDHEPGTLGGQPFKKRTAIQTQKKEPASFEAGSRL